MSETPTTIDLKQQSDYRFEVHFGRGGIPPLVTDEPPPLGGDGGPDPLQLLAASVGNCLAASLLFALRKFHNEPKSLRARVTLHTRRNEHRRLRVGHIDVELQLGVDAAELPALPRAMAGFEDYCTVTQSLRAALPIAVRVVDRGGRAVAPHTSLEFA